MNLKNLLYSIVFLSSASVSAIDFNDDSILDVNKAFAINAFIFDEKIQASWEIHPGYYLYKESISLKVNGLPIEFILDLSNESKQEDIFFGQSMVLKDFLKLESASKHGNLSNATIEISYQGCAEGKYCYPKKIKIL